MHEKRIPDCVSGERDNRYRVPHPRKGGNNMNKLQYRAAVQSIRWSAEKRAEIESRLRSAAGTAVQHESQWNHESDDLTVSVTHADISRVEEYDMKQRKIRRILLTGLVAAILATAGAVAATAAYAKKHPQKQNVTIKNGIALHLTGQEAAPCAYGYNGYTPNNNADTVAENIVAADNGWFFRNSIIDYDRMTDWGFPRRYFPLSYADRESGKTVTVCAKPNCLHDGNEYCTATTDRYAYSDLTMYDGYLYAVTTKYLKPEERRSFEYIDQNPTEQNADCRQVLLRYAPDGTEITELCEFGTGEGTSRCTVHRGYVWCIVQIQNVGEQIENPITHSITTFASGGWQIQGYELATGKTVCIYDAVGKADINHINQTPQGLYASGDYLYYNRNDGDWSGSYGLYRLSLITGEEEKIGAAHGMPQISKTHALLTESKVVNGKETTEWILVDLQTLEKKKIEPATGHIEIMDEQYLYSYNYADYNDPNGVDVTISVFDYDGKPVAEVPTGFRNCHVDMRIEDENKYASYNQGCQIKAICDGTIYLEHFVNGTGQSPLLGIAAKDEIRLLKKEKALYSDAPEEPVREMLCCTVDELLKGGTPDWKLAFDLKEEVRGNAEQ